MSERNLSVELRPASFDAVIGNAEATAAIRKQLASLNSPIAWLLCGPPGVGKTTLAELIAVAVQGTTGEFEINRLNAADKNGVEDARLLVEKSEFLPFTGKYRVNILDEAHKLTEPAQNALLIPLESKDSSTIWIFTTTEPTRLLPALRRRCWSVALRGLNPKEREALVKRVCADADPKPLLDAMDAANLTSPGEIVMATERWMRGIPAGDACAVAGHEPLYSEVAKAALCGDWEKTRAQLKQIKAADSKALRAVLAAFFSNALVDCAAGPRAVALSYTLRAMAAQFAYEDGVSLGGTKGLLYDAAVRLKAAKEEF